MTLPQPSLQDAKRRRDSTYIPIAPAQAELHCSEACVSNKSSVLLSPHQTCFHSSVLPDCLALVANAPCWRPMQLQQVIQGVRNHEELLEPGEDG